jgi:hypothetical protein
MNKYERGITFSALSMIVSATSSSIPGVVMAVILIGYSIWALFRP